MKTRVLLITTLLLSLTGCASINDYHEPQAGAAATVSGSSTRNGLFDWNSTTVTAIDNKNVGMVWSESSKIKVTPGTHRFTVYTQFNQTFGGGGPFNGFVDVSATVRPNQYYRFVTKVDGASIKAWAVDANGRVSSSIGSNHYEVAPRNIPIIIYN